MNSDTNGRETFKGTRQSFEKIWELYSPKVFGILLSRTGNREEAEDLTQDTFLRAWRNRDSYEPRSDATFESWLYTIAINVHINEYTREKREKERKSKKK